MGVGGLKRGKCKDPVMNGEVEGNMVYIIIR